MFGTSGGGIKSVLVVDDEQHIVRLIESNLKRQGYEVSCAYGGKEAILALECRPFDLVILDFYMPAVSGCEVLRWIRTHEISKGTFVWMLASEEEVVADESCRGHRADRYSDKGRASSITSGASSLFANTDPETSSVFHRFIPSRMRGDGNVGPLALPHQPGDPPSQGR